jgi:hypothetical protein
MRSLMVRYTSAKGWEIFRRSGWREMPLWGARALLGEEAVVGAMLGSTAPAMPLPLAA